MSIFYLSANEFTKPLPFPWAIVGWFVIIGGIYLVSQHEKSVEPRDSNRRKKEFEERIKRENSLTKEDRE